MASKNYMEQPELVELFSALGDKTRFSLLKILNRDKQICVSELAQEIGISTAGVSQQLKILEQAGLIQRNRVGQKICYQLKRDTKQKRRLIAMLG